MVTKLTTVIKAPVWPKPAIINPTMAWPKMEAVNQIPWLQVVAFCNKSLGIIAPTMVPKLGPVKDLIIPVQKTTKYIQIAIIRALLFAKALA